MSTILEHIQHKILASPFDEDFLRQRKFHKVVFTNGCFDVLHYGHVVYLAQARQLGDLLVVAVNSDDSVRRLKGPARPVNPLTARTYTLAALEMVDFVLSFEEDTPYRLITELKPDVLVKGGDYATNQIVGADFVLQHGGSVHVIPFVKDFSTTSTLNKLSK